MQSTMFKCDVCNKVADLFATLNLDIKKTDGSIQTITKEVDAPCFQRIVDTLNGVKKTRKPRKQKGE